MIATQKGSLHGLIKQGIVHTSKNLERTKGYTCMK